MQRLIAALSLALFATAAPAQTPYANRPITVVVPYPPGGTTDAMGRITAKGLETKLKVPVVVENRPGASGTIGSDSVRRAAADGYTLLFNASIFLLGKNVLKATPYDPVADFTPVGRVGQTPLILLANPNVPATDLKEFLALAKRDPKRFMFANSAAGSAGHLTTIEFNRLSGLGLDIVTYRGSAPALTDLIGGHVHLMVDPLGVALPHVKAGKLKALAITSRERSPAAPDIPTVAESGMPELVFSSWYGVWGPRGLPAEVIDRLEKALAAAVRDAEVQQRMAALGVEPIAEAHASFSAFIAQDNKRNEALLKAAGFQPE